jgi:hypothetical protein
MAIAITSLTPVSPVIQAGSTVTFTVVATESNNETLSYEWQYSLDGGANYTSSGLFNNTSASFTTSPLSSNQSGIRFRVRIQNESNEVVFSNDVPTIGDRVVVVEAAPAIRIIQEYDPSYTIPIAGDLDLLVQIGIDNIDSSDPNNLSGVAVQWQESPDDGVTWNNITAGTFGNFTYSILTETYQIAASPLTYGVSSVLTLENLTFSSNNYQYRARVTYTGASNTPTILSPAVLLVNPTISIFQNPGENANDTKLPVQCYKTSIANSGEVRVSVGAFTTAGQTLAYTWEFATVDYNGTQSTWFPLSDGLEQFWFRFVPGTNGTTDVLQLDRLIYFEQIGFRVTIEGSAGEVPVTSDEYFIYMKDVQISPENLGDKQSLEDFYDPSIVPNSERNLYTDYPIQNIIYDSYVDTNRNSGLNGKIVLQYQRQAPGSSIWEDVGNENIFSPQYDQYTAFPNSNLVPFEASYTTTPLRIDLDNQSKYRLKVTSTAVYTLAGTTKTLTPFYSDISTVTVYRAVYIISSPLASNAFNNQTASFGVSAQTTSPATITYQWQTSTSTAGPWTNLTNTSPYGGATTNLLTITPATLSLNNQYYRCVVDSTNTLGTATTSAAKLTVRRDAISAITSLNDYSVNEYDNVTWQVEARSASLAALSFQWQRSTNYSPLNPTAATWTDISGQTSDTYTITSVLTPENDGYYRCEITSSGGEVAYTNAAFLDISPLDIVISQNIPTTRTFLEGIQNEYTFTIIAAATEGPLPSYQWQIKRVGDADFSNFGLGYNNQISTSSRYTPQAFDRDVDNGAVIRCRLSSPDIPTPVYSNECTITVNRRFYYFADSAIKNANVGGNFALNLSPSYTTPNGTVVGDETQAGIASPSYQWQRSTNGGSTWSNISGETASSLLLTNITAGMDSYLYRCQITFDNCSQHQYSRNNTTFIEAATTIDFTETVELNVVSAIIAPNFYSKETQKNGAAIGTVICVPKPGGYINDTGATTDDISLWKIATTGDISQTGTTSSTVMSGTIYLTNKPSWVTDANYKSPKWLLSDDRFPGFIEMRGQWVLKSEFPVLYSVLGNSYGETSTLFRLPNPYGKKFMGTGNVNNNSGGTSIIPLYNADGTSGGDKYEAGSIGGVWNYVKSKQLPPGSPNQSNEADGTAGNPDPETFALGNFRTDGWTDSEGTAQTAFNGSFTFVVGPLLQSNVTTVPPHSHFGISAGFEPGLIADSGGCRSQGTIDPPFYGTAEEGGDVLSGPEGVPETDRGLPHNHALSTTPGTAGNGAANHEDGIGDISGASDSVTTTVNLHADRNSSNPSVNLVLEPVNVRLTNACRPIFDSSINFYLRNAEQLPVNSNYFRLKYLIKAY